MNKHEWSIEIILACSDSRMKHKPMVYLSGYGTKKNLLLELSPSAFEELRYKVAECLDIVTQCEESPALQKKRKM